MQLHDQYDWVVLGDHPGALLSACMASQLGLRSLVLPLAPSLLTSISSTGQCLDPEPNYVLGLSRFGSAVGLLAESLSQLGASGFASKLIQPAEAVTPQVLTPGSRLELGLEDDGLFHSLEREFGHEIAKASGLLGALSLAESRALSHWRAFPRLVMQAHSKASGSRLNISWDPASERRTLENLRLALSRPKGDTKQSSRVPSRVWLRRDFGIRELKERLPLFQKTKTTRLAPAKLDALWEDFSESLAGLWFAVCGSSLEDPKAIDWAHLVSLARTAGSFRGGLTAYRRFLMGLAERLGAHLPEGSECRRIYVEDGKLLGVQLAEKGKMIGAKAGVVGCSLAQAREYLSLSGREALRKLKRPPEPCGWRFTLALTLHAEAIPVGMGSRAIWKEKNAPALEIEVARPEDYGLGTQQMRFVFLRTSMPFTQESLSVDYQRLVAARMFKQLMEIFPFLEFHVTQVYPDFRGTETSSRDEFSEAYGFVSTDFIPENLRLFGDEGGLGASSGIRNLYVATGESYPLMGSFGPTVAAIESVSRHACTLGPQHQERLKDFWSFLE